MSRLVVQAFDPFTKAVKNIPLDALLPSKQSGDGFSKKCGSCSDHSSCKKCVSHTSCPQRAVCPPFQEVNGTFHIFSPVEDPPEPSSTFTPDIQSFTVFPPGALTSEGPDIVFREAGTYMVNTEFVVYNNSGDIVRINVTPNTSNGAITSQAQFPQIRVDSYTYSVVGGIDTTEDSFLTCANLFLANAVIDIDTTTANAVEFESIDCANALADVVTTEFEFVANVDFTNVESTIVLDTLDIPVISQEVLSTNIALTSLVAVPIVANIDLNVTTANVVGGIANILVEAFISSDGPTLECANAFTDIAVTANSFVLCGAGNLANVLTSFAFANASFLASAAPITISTVPGTVTANVLNCDGVTCSQFFGLAAPPPTANVISSTTTASAVTNLTAANVLVQPFDANACAEALTDIAAVGNTFLLCNANTVLANAIVGLDLFESTVVSNIVSTVELPIVVPILETNALFLEPNANTLIANVVASISVANVTSSLLTGITVGNAVIGLDLINSANFVLCDPLLPIEVVESVDTIIAPFLTGNLECANAVTSVSPVFEDVIDSGTGVAYGSVIVDTPVGGKISFTLSVSGGLFWDGVTISSGRYLVEKLRA